MSTKVHCGKFCQIPSYLMYVYANGIHKTYIYQISWSYLNFQKHLCSCSLLMKSFFLYIYLLYSNIKDIHSVLEVTVYDEDRSAQLSQQRVNGQGSWMVTSQMLSSNPWLLQFIPVTRWTDSCWTYANNYIAMKLRMLILRRSEFCRGRVGRKRWMFPLCSQWYTLANCW